MDAQDNLTATELQQIYDKAIENVGAISSLIKQIGNNNQLQNLQDIINKQEYLQLLASTLFALNSLAHSYSKLKSAQMPPQFDKVKEYYMKVKNALAGVQPVKPINQNPIVLNKEAAARLISSAIK